MIIILLYGGMRCLRLKPAASAKPLLCLSLHPETCQQLPKWIEEIVGNVYQAYVAKYQVDYRQGVPSVQNDYGITPGKNKLHVRLLLRTSRTCNLFNAQPLRNWHIFCIWVLVSRIALTKKNENDYH